MAPKSSPTSKQPRRFAPLGEKSNDKASAGLPKLKGIVFDVDGTLCEPQTYMFAEMRTATSCPPHTDILTHISAKPLPEQAKDMASLRAIESRAMLSQVPQPGLVPLMTYLESKSIPKAICTRNFDAPVNHLLENFLPGMRFEPIVTRDFKPPKPRPEGIWWIAGGWGFWKEGERDGEGGEKGERKADASGLIMVGDSLDDMTAGHHAGAATVLLVNDVNAHLATHEHTDLCISRLDELIDILEAGFVGQIGRDEMDGDTRGRAEEVLREGKGERSGT